MNTKEIIQKSLSLDYKSDTHVDSREIWLPPGWHDFYDIFSERLLDLGGKIVRMYYLKGVLRVDLFDKEDLPTKWLSQGMMKHSALTCLVCGKSALRRKAYEGWPPLCSTHIIEYANQLEE